MSYTSNSVSTPARLFELACATDFGATEFSAACDYDQQKEHVNKIKRSNLHRLKRHKSYAHNMTGAQLYDELQLRQAVYNGNDALVSELLSQGINASCTDHKLRSPLHIATAAGNERIVRLLLENGADINQKDSIGNTPLHLAACSNNIPVITALLQYGTDINSLDRLGRTPLHLAVGHLRLLHQDHEYSSEQLKAAVAQIVAMMKAYMERSCCHGDEVMTQLSSLSEQLELTVTIEEIDSVSNLLSDFAQLQINRIHHAPR